MRIGIDARPMDSVNMTGIGVYVCNLLDNLAKIDKKNEYVLYFSSLRRNAKKMPGPLASNFVKKVIRLPYVSDSDFFSSLWVDLLLPQQLIRDNIDVFHSTYAYTPANNSVKTVTTIHDLNFMVCDKLKESAHARHCEKVYRKAIKGSSLFISVSHNTTSDIEKWLNVPSEKIRTIYSGRDESFTVITDDLILNSIRDKFKLPQKFILALGSTKDRKNIKRLISAYALFVEKYNLDYKLVITSIKSIEQVNIADLSDNVLKNIICLGYVSSESLPSLYNLSNLFVYPSLYEGFGFPLLEAMACGVPIIGSGVSSIPEVVNDAAVLIDPYNETEIAKAMYGVLSNREIRNDLVAKGLERVKQFDWLKTASETINVYNEAM